MHYIHTVRLINKVKTYLNLSVLKSQHITFVKGICKNKQETLKLDTL